MSAGIQDAVNLGWKLAAAIRGWAADGLLDSYHRERHPVGRRVLANTLAQRIVYLGGDEMDPLRSVLAELLAYPDVQRHLVGMVTGLDIRYDVGCDHPLAGRRLPAVELVTANGEPATTSTFEPLQGARGVLFDLADSDLADGARLKDAAAGWADRVQVITAAPRPGSPLDDVAALLVRPDGYIAWASRPGQGADGLPEAFARWFGRPAT